MKKILLLIIFLAWGGLSEAYEKVMVIKPNANLRAKPTVNSEVVFQIQPNEVLEAKNIQEEWVEIVPPTNVDFYVFSDYIKDGIVECSQKLNIRAGPGINFSIVGQLENGEKVSVRGTVSEWCRIAPPKNSSLWIHRSLVEPLTPSPAEEKKKEEDKISPPSPAKAMQEDTQKEPVLKTSLEKNASTENKTSKSSSKEDKEPVRIAERTSFTEISGKRQEPKLSTATPSKDIATTVAQKSDKDDEPSTKETTAPSGKRDTNALAQKTIVAVAPQENVMPPQIVQRNTMIADLDLVPSERQGEPTVVEGFLRRKQYLLRSPADFRLVVYDSEGNPQTVCYVKGNTIQLEALLHRELKIYGRKFWVKKQKYPIVIPERIILK